MMSVLPACSTSLNATVAASAVARRSSARVAFVSRVSSSPSTRRRVVVTRASVEAQSSESSTATASEDSSLAWAPEVLNGRLAMVGFVVGAQVEAGSSDATLITQLHDNAVGVVLFAALISWASIVPFKFNPQVGFDSGFFFYFFF